MLAAPVDLDEQAMLQFTDAQTDEQIRTKHGTSAEVRHLPPAAGLGLELDDVEGTAPGGHRQVNR